MRLTGGEYLGADALVQGTLGGAEALMRVPGQALAPTGSVLRLGLGAHDLHLFDADTGKRFELPQLASLTTRLDTPAGRPGVTTPLSHWQDL